MEPGKVFYADTLAPEDVYVRGQGQCYSLIKSGSYAEAMTATEIHLTGNASPKGSKDCSTLIFVRFGTASLEIIGSDVDNSVQVSSGSAVHIQSGESYFWAHGDNLIALEVTIPDTSGPYARREKTEVNTFKRLVVQGDSLKDDATSDRQFEVLIDSTSGSSGATMFIGFIPPSGAPSHYHLYDEICYIVRGSGEFKVGDHSQKISQGSTFAVVPRLLHSVVNNSDEDLWILGIFRPEGSPAAAYYPDGKPAPGYSELS
jgi:mannose-6-phosphate isomerase-like protein (cupin superfamily)